MPDDALKCLESWKRFFPDWEIVRWDEDNFDVRCNRYVREAYEARKYAFVSDFARFWILHRHGGVYFDTDVEVIQPMADIISRGPFMGYEQDPDGVQVGKVAAGLGLGAPAGMEVYRRVVEYYDGLSFLDQGGNIYPVTVVEHVTRGVLVPMGLTPQPGIQQLAGVYIYPAEYFNPKDSTTGIIRTTGNTRTIHHYSASWVDHGSAAFRLHRLKNALISVVGPRPINWLVSTFRLSQLRDRLLK